MAPLVSPWTLFWREPLSWWPERKRGIPFDFGISSNASTPKTATGLVYLTVDGHQVHKSRSVKAFVARHAKYLRMILLPMYCPELNPDEWPNHDGKTNALGKSRPRHKPEMMATVRRHLYRRQKQPAVVRNLFRERHVGYAA